MWGRFQEALRPSRQPGTQLDWEDECARRAVRPQVPPGVERQLGQAREKSQRIGPSGKLADQSSRHTKFQPTVTPPPKLCTLLPQGTFPHTGAGERALLTTSDRITWRSQLQILRRTRKRP